MADGAGALPACSTEENPSDSCTTDDCSDILSTDKQDTIKDASGEIGHTGRIPQIEVVDLGNEEPLRVTDEEGRSPSNNCENSVLGVENSVLNPENSVQDTENSVLEFENSVQDAENSVQDAENYVQDAENSVLDSENSVQDAENSVLDSVNSVQVAENSVLGTENSVQDAENSVLDSINSVQVAENSVLGTENSVLDTENSVQDAENPVLDTENSVQDPENSVLDTENSVLGTGNSGLDAENSVLVAENPVLDPANSALDSGNCVLVAEKCVLDAENSQGSVTGRLSPALSTNEVEDASFCHSTDNGNIDNCVSTLKEGSKALLIEESVNCDKESHNEENSSSTNNSNSFCSNKGPQLLRRILYSGYKKKESNLSISKPEKKIIARSNPFNPSWRKEPKIIKSISDCDKNVIDLTTSTDGTGLCIQDCTHYLGLQPSINFRCNHCGISGFESIQLLNLHQVECRKVLGHSTSTNIKITRKVYLCSACGTYYESWHLFYHMRKVHDKFMCLYCLGMFTFSEKLCEHLMVKHQVNFINFPDFESFKKCNLSSYLFLCLDCDNVMSDSDNFRHVCTPQKVLSKLLPKHAVSVPCVGTVTVVGAPPKKVLQDSNNASKGNFNDDFINDASNFCHVDMNSPKKENTPETQPNNKKVNESPKSQSVRSEFPKIDLLPPKNTSNESYLPEKDLEPVCSPKALEDGSNQDLETKLVENSKPENKNSIKKSVKRQRMNTGRQNKRTKLDPEQQKSALVKLTETIDAVAKNYQIEDSTPLIPTLMDSNEKNVKVNEPLVTNHEDLPLEENQDLDKGTVEDTGEHQKEDVKLNSINDTVKEDASTNGVPDKPLIWKSVPDKNLSKFKLHTDLESDEESDDSNKLSMAIDDTPAHSDNDSKTAKATIKGIFNTSDDSSQSKDIHDDIPPGVRQEYSGNKPKHDEIALAGEDVPAMALTLDDKVEDVKVQHILKECVRTSCMSCNYCRRAVKIAVNGKFLALHLLSEHRYTPTKNDSPEDVINKLKSSLEELSDVYFNTESYDSSDSSIHIPYDKDNTFDCFQCSYVTYSHKDLYIHKRKSHTKSLLLCIMCKINFYSYSELLCHLCPGHYDSDQQLNNVDINFRCCFCQLDTIPSAFRLMVHLRKCHHTCDICLEICSDQQKLSTHMWKHKLNHLCYRCGIAYASKLDITKHLFWKHGTESVLCKKCLQKKWPHVYHFCIPPTSFLCEECNSSFSKAVALKVHKRIHAGDFSYHCTQCEKKFVSKKLLQKHEDHHNNPVSSTEQEDKGKEEIIDVTGESTGNVDGVGEAHIDTVDNQKESDKENESGKHHKKHKKDKKGKQVIDVYDLPPLNLSSDSDSSDDESTKNALNDTEKEENDSECKNIEASSNVKENVEPLKDITDLDVSNNPISATPSSEPDSIQNMLPANQLTEDTDKASLKEISDNSFDEINSTDAKTSNSDEQANVPEEPRQNTSIWENFYKINSTNKNLPYPLCAMRTEDAYKIIMGDHDYCLQLKTSDPVIKEDIPTQSNLEENKIDSTNTLSKTELSETTASDSSPTKKKQKSPKKKAGNNSSSSSDSSTDSDSSSCSCGDNCSCSSSSSDSSSSSSSDSDSSASDTANKQRTDKRKKRKDKKTKTVKNLSVVDQNGENKTIVESTTPLVPEEPAIRESDLETDESSTDEEFYDRQPQKITNQLLAEKRNQLMLLASVAPAHGEGLGHELTKSSTFNDTYSEQAGAVPPIPDLSNQSAKKVSKARRRKKFMLKSRKRVNKNYSFNNVPQPIESAHKSPKPFNLLKPKELKRQEKQPFDVHTPPSIIRSHLPSETNSGGGSENESVRSSKRKRVPNKFYGYSSGEEEERAQPKWRKPEVLTPPPPSPVSTPKFVHTTPQTPRIQLSLPKQIIRKNQNESPKVRHYLSGNDSTDSSSDNDKRFSQPPKPQPPAPAPLPPPPPPPPPPQATKQDKNLYCYCRCPYDEVSEMIACDDENCKIEWFHFECVGISVPPKGQWFCPQCSKKRGILP